MGVEFRLSSGDHKVVEDFLATHPSGVSAVVLSPRAAQREQAAAEQAREVGIEVYWDPMTDRLIRPGFGVPGISDALGLIHVDELHASAGARRQLATVVKRAHPDFVSARTPPHFVVESPADWALNLDLACRFREVAADKPVRPSLILSSRLPIDQVRMIAAGYKAQGFDQIELRITPLGGEDQSPRKVRTAFAALKVFVDSNMETTLGCSGTLGQTAMAIGHAQHYSVGVGFLEHVNHASTMTRQQQPRKPGRGFGAHAGIYMAPLACTVPVKFGSALLATASIRTRVSCKLGDCKNSVLGPAASPREHYLHTRAHEAEFVLERPAAWRLNGELDRLRIARNLRAQVNEKYLPEGSSALKMRTLGALIDILTSDQAQQVG